MISFSIFSTCYFSSYLLLFFLTTGAWGSSSSMVLILRGELWRNSLDPNRNIALIEFCMVSAWCSKTLRCCKSLLTLLIHTSCSPCLERNDLYRFADIVDREYENKRLCISTNVLIIIFYFLRCFHGNCIFYHHSVLSIEGAEIASEDVRLVGYFLEFVIVELTNEMVCFLRDKRCNIQIIDEYGEILMELFSFGHQDETRVKN